MQASRKRPSGPSKRVSTARIQVRPWTIDKSAGYSRVTQHLLRPGERLLRVDHPIDLAQRRQVRREGLALGEAGVIAEELELTGLMGANKLVKHQTAEQLRENLDRQKIARSPGTAAMSPGTIGCPAGHLRARSRRFRAAS